MWYIKSVNNLAGGIGYLYSTHYKAQSVDNSFTRLSPEMKKELGHEA
jgi:hypothetical protein